MKRTLITGAEAIGKAIKSFGIKYANVQNLGHVAFISALIHTVKYGNADLLNAFYKKLETNDQSAVRLYLGRLTAIVGGWDGETKTTSEQMTEYRTKGSFIEYADKTFHVIPEEVSEDAPANREYVEGLADTMLNPDGETWRDVFARNNLSEIRTLGDEQVIAKLDKLIKEASGDSKNYSASVSPAIIETLKTARKQMPLVGKTVEVLQ